MSTMPIEESRDDEMRSDPSQSEPLLDGVVHVTFQNNSGFPVKYKIVDLRTDQQLFYNTLAGAGDGDGSRTTLTLSSDGIAGNASYQADGESTPTDCDNLTEGDTVYMS